MIKRPYSQQPKVRAQIEADAARSARRSYANWYTTAEINRIRHGESKPLFTPGTFGGKRKAK